MKPSEKELLDMGINVKGIQYIHAYISEEKDAIDIENRRINFVISSEIIDRADEVVEAQAVFDAIHRKGEFIENPICLACHWHRLENGMPSAVGSWDPTTARIVTRRGKKQVEMVDQFDTELKLGSEYWIAYKNRTMRAVSISFRILDYRVEDQNGKRIFIVTKLELIEISCVAIGCNKEALARLKSMGLVPEEKADSSDLAARLEAFEKAMTQRLDRLEETQTAAMDELKDLLCSNSKEFYTDPDSDEQDDVLGKSSVESGGGDTFAERFEKRLDEQMTRSRGQKGS